MNNLTYMNDQVVDFKQDNMGLVKSLKTKKGKTIKGDLFIDCSGFAKVLIDKVEKNDWISYEDGLLVNSALNFNYISGVPEIFSIIETKFINLS